MAIVLIFMVEVVMIPTLDFSVWSVKNTDLASGGAKELTPLGNENQRSRVLGLQPLCSLTSLWFWGASPQADYCWKSAGSVPFPAERELLLGSDTWV